jgi:hypothetical protein
MKVLIQESYGSGWSEGQYYSYDHDSSSRWAIKYWLLTHSGVIEATEAGESYPHKDLIAEARAIFGENIHINVSSISELSVVDIPPGKKFRIHEYDGSECVVFDDVDDWFTS